MVGQRVKVTTVNERPERRSCPKRSHDVLPASDDPPNDCLKVIHQVMSRHIMSRRSEYKDRGIRSAVINNLAYL